MVQRLRLNATYIDTGYVPTANTVVKMGVYFHPYSDIKMAFGVFVSGANDFCFWKEANDNINARIGNASVASGGLTQYKGGGRYMDVEQGKGYTKIDGNEVWSGKTFTPSQYSIWIGNVNGTFTTNWINGTIDCEYFRVYEDDVLVLDLVPYTENGVACMRDTITGTLYNAVDSSKCSIIDQNKRYLEYISTNDNNSYVDTLVVPDLNTSIEFDMNITSLGRGDYIGIQERPWYGLCVWLSNWQAVITARGVATPVLNPNTDYHIMWDSQKFTANGVDYIYPGTGETFVPNLTFWIGRINNGQQSGVAGVKYGTFIFRRNGQVEKIFQPGENYGIVGMWETISNTFYAPKNGSFTGGPLKMNAEISNTEFSYKASSGTITVNSYGNDWTITAPEGVVLSQTSGSDNAVVDFSIPENKGEKRHFIISVDIAGAIFQFDVIQNEKGIVSNGMFANGNVFKKLYLNGRWIFNNIGHYPVIKVGDINVLKRGIDEDIEVISNAKWEVTTDVDWITLNNATGEGNGSFHITIPETEENRTGHLNVVCYNTASTITQVIEIIQNASFYKINLNSSWRLTETDVPNPDPDVYDGVYESSSNYHKGSSKAIMYIDISGYDEFTFYIRSNGENNYDFMQVCQIDTETSGYANTKGKSNANTDITAYTKVTYSDLGQTEHRICLWYLKDISRDEGTDRGYLLIPKKQ